MEFGITDNFVYNLYINKSDYEKNKHWSCNTGNYLRSDLRQHLPRWVFLPCTSKSSGRDCKQKLLKQEKGCSFPQRIAKRVIKDFLKRGQGLGVKALGPFFYVPSV
jgi:hypothetical protein